MNFSSICAILGFIVIFCIFGAPPTTPLNISISYDGLHFNLSHCENRDKVLFFISLKTNDKAGIRTLSSLCRWSVGCRKCKGLKKNYRNKRPDCRKCKVIIQCCKSRFMLTSKVVVKSRDIQKIFINAKPVYVKKANNLLMSMKYGSHA